MADYAIEKLDNAFADLNLMLPAHWEFVGDSDVAQQPNWPLYRKCEALNAAFLVMARDRGHPVGFMVVFIYPHPNAMSVLTADIKTYYVEPGRSILLKSMAEFVLQELAHRGIYRVKAWTHAGHPATRLWEALGFELSELGFTLKFRPPAGVRHA